jgi:hypothetical protein
VSLVLVAGATLQCSHGGSIVLSSSETRLTVDGKGAVVLGGESGLSFAAGVPPCPNATTSTPPTPAPCQTGAALAGAARVLEVGGKPVLLATANGVTSPKGTPPGTWKVADAGQQKLEAS